MQLYVAAFGGPTCCSRFASGAFPCSLPVLANRVRLRVSRHHLTLTTKRDQKMHEIVTLQFGQKSNYLATHFWNAQVSRRPAKLLGIDMGRNLTSHIPMTKSHR